MKNSHKVLLGLFLITLLSISSIVRAYCPPYFAEIDSIEPKYECLDISDETRYCGGSIEITNHCEGKFYDLEEKTGNHYIGAVLRAEPGFDGCQGERIVGGINVCDESELEKAGTGTVVKYWT